MRKITNQDIKEYHEKYYRPENFQLTITGQISPHELFESLDVIETKIVQKRHLFRPLNEMPPTKSGSTIFSDAHNGRKV